MDNFCGKRIDGRYEIKEIIGVGGMAVVYKAYDNIDDRIVAIKILKDEYLSNEEFKRRFKNESKAIAVLSHPNIVRVFNVSFGDRIQYIVMEYVNGITLKEYIEQQGAINWKEAVHFMGQILAALQHAHDKGIVHQDIKPQNILLLQDGTIKVTDFGIARFSRTDSNTTSDKAIGSVHYISPEQARGEVTDDKADIYSVGVVMYEMLTGQLPFQSDSAVSVAIMQLQQDPKLPREIVPTIPLGLEQITMRAMQKSPNSRYGSAAEMLMDINEFKRNPSVKFDYNYFVDSEPTKYIRTNNVPNREQRVMNENNTAEKSAMNKTTAVMMGAVAGIIVLALIIGAILMGTSNQKVEVPNFTGFNYYTQIENVKTYTDIFNFEIKIEENSTLEDGTVITQDPDSSTKVKKGSTITLTIAQKNSILLDASIIGMTEEKAKSYLNSRSIISTVITEYSDTVTPGCVVRTSPEIGSTVRIGSEVVLYIATDTQETVKMPDIQGSSREAAEQALNAVDLEVGTVTEVNSELEAGIVVQQSVEKDTEVPIGSKIDFSVSNGIPPASSVDVYVTLPSVNKTGILKIYLNSVLFYTSEELYLDGATKQFTLSGSGSENNYTITIDDSPVQKGKVDFTQEPAVITEVEEITFENKVVLINVEGMREQEAIDKLKNAGFKNVETVKQPSVTVPYGVVISQIPNADGITKYSTNESITLNVSSGAPATY
ncbi:MAG: Stk1 family PASTA domain-containing Ser/Thr kinase [Clostridia bacterium]|nr:Stk1 family PASTA domain-containing Ser/Thr kinase [Clostridia bacterium]